MIVYQIATLSLFHAHLDMHEHERKVSVTKLFLLSSIYLVVCICVQHTLF